MEQFISIIIFIIAANIIYLIVSLIKQGFKHYANYIAQLLFLVIAIFWLLKREVSPGWVLFISLLGIYILVILPSQIQRKIDILIAEKRYDEIDFFAKIKANLAWSNLNSHFQEIAEIAAKYSENPIKMVDSLKELLNRGDPYDRMTRNFLGFIHFNNRNFNDLINDLKIPDKTFEENSFDELLYLVRAYLETTRYEEAIEAQIALEKKVYEDPEDKTEKEYNILISRLLFYAFMGWKDEYDTLYNSGEGNLNQLTQELRDFWRGVCYFNSGAFIDGEKIMRDAINAVPDDFFGMKELMQIRLSGMLEHKVFFSEHVLPKLKELYLNNKNRLSDVITQNQKLNIEIVQEKKATNILAFTITVISVIWLIKFDVYDILELLNMGATSSFLVKNGEYFRLISYSFIHIGYIHLFMNLLALKYFGPPVETISGRSSFLLIFFLSVISGGALSTYMGTPLTAGASGGIFGLLAASIVFEVFKVKGYNNFSHKSNIFNLIFIIIINIAYGYFQAGIDNSAHFGGLIAGAILGFILVPFLKNQGTKSIMNILSSVLVFIILFYTINTHINSFKEKSLYPSSINSYQSKEISNLFKVEFPNFWEFKEIISKEVTGASIKGPVGENLRIIKIVYDSPYSFIDKDTILKEYIEEKNSYIEKSEKIESMSIKGPVKVSYQNDTYKIFWDIKLDSSKSFFEDHIIFTNNSLYIITFSMATKHYDFYEPIIKHIVSSFEAKHN